jgi:AcrR family transcriptional regulator
MTDTQTIRSPRPGDTRARILEAAIDLFSVNGFSGVSIRDLAGAVGIKQSSFYSHYPSKESLLADIFRLYEQEYTNLIPSEERVDRILETITPEQFWENGFRNFKELMGSPRMEKMTRILTLEMYRNERARDILLEHSIHAPVDFAEKIFGRLIERGQIRALDPRLLAVEFESTLFALFIEYLVLHSAGQDTSAVEQRVVDHIHFFSELVKKGDEQ